MLVTKEWPETFGSDETSEELQGDDDQIWDNMKEIRTGRGQSEGIQEKPSSNKRTRTSKESHPGNRTLKKAKKI